MKNHKTVFVHIGNNPDLSELIQKRCFAAGVYWADGGTKVIPEATTYKEESCIGVHEYGLGFGTRGGAYAKTQELTVAQFLDHVKKSISVKLNNEYTAEIKDGKVQVGCQTIEFGPILELAEKIKSAQEASK